MSHIYTDTHTHTHTHTYLYTCTYIHNEDRVTIHIGVIKLHLFPPNKNFVW